MISWRVVRDRLRQHWLGPMYFRSYQQIQSARREYEQALERRVAELEAALAARDGELQQLQQFSRQAIDGAITDWVQRRLRQPEFWREVVAQFIRLPKGREIWERQVFELLDQLTDYEKAELLFRYLSSRGLEVSLKLADPAAKKLALGVETSDESSGPTESTAGVSEPVCVRDGALQPERPEH